MWRQVTEILSTLFTLAAKNRHENAFQSTFLHYHAKALWQLIIAAIVSDNHWHIVAVCVDLLSGNSPETITIIHGGNTEMYILIEAVFVHSRHEGKNIH